MKSITDSISIGGWLIGFVCVVSPINLTSLCRCFPFFFLYIMSLRPFRVLQDRTVCITGASSGIGAAIATSLAAQGANIALGSRRSEKLEEVSRIMVFLFVFLL